jgi:hypothetical protein
LADESITQLYGMPSDKAFDAVCAAVADLSEYRVKQIHPEVMSGHWSSKTGNQAFLEVQVSPEGTGSRIVVELRNADMRDRLGLLRREANRVAGRIQQRMESQVTGFAPPPPKRAVTDRMVIFGALIGAFGFGALYSIYMKLAALF